MPNPRRGHPIGQGGHPGGSPRRAPLFSGRTTLIYFVMVILFYVFFFMSAGASKQSPPVSIPYSTFVNQVRANHVATAQVSDTTVSGAFTTPYHAQGTRYTRYTTTLLPLPDTTLVPLLETHHVQLAGVNQTPAAWTVWLGYLITAVPFIFLVGLFYVISRRAGGQQQGLFGFGQSKAKLYTEERPRTTFADVAGIEAAKRELTEEVDFLVPPH